MTVLIVPAILLALSVLTLAALAALKSCPISAERARALLELKTERIRRSRPDLAGTGLTLVHPSSGFRGSFGADAEPGSRVFHAASVGKLFTAVLIGRLVEEGRIRWDTRVADILPPGNLDGLYLRGGKDHRDEVSVKMLLSHTSGAADYFGDPGRSGKSVSALIVENPDRSWTPDELLAFSRDEQKPAAPPGAAFHYSDTGYVLLGRIVEELRGAPYHKVLRREIFEPAGMRDAYMPLREPSPPNVPALRPAYLGGTDLSRSKALSADWAGGGVALSADDLLAFGGALDAGLLLKPTTLARMADFRWTFRRGIRYGLGFMELRFGEFFPLLKSWPSLRGHMGILGIQFFWNPGDGTAVVVSLCSDRHMADSVRLLIAALGVLRRIRN
ncbi:MAG TPA: serine hydrolase domain-containing protein [Magnetospirillaceae bacterium]|nr:serine hydrolase domain-containing protein [Magnetospirillaceae bacterium]